MKIQSNLLLLLLFLIGFLSSTYSFTIKGTISDTCTQDSVNYIKGADVFLQVDNEIIMKTKSNEYGKFSFFDIGDKNYGKISIKIIGLNNYEYVFSEQEIQNKIKSPRVSNISLSDAAFFLKLDLCTNREKRNTTKNIFVTNINNQQESPEIHYPFQKVKLIKENKPKNNKKVSLDFKENFERWKNRIKQRKYNRKNSHKEKENYLLYRTKKDSMVQKHLNPYRLTVFFISKFTKKSIYPFTQTSNQGVKSFYRTEANFCFGKDINSFYYKGKKVDVRGNSKIFILHKYKGEIPSNFRNYLYINNEIDYIWTNNFKDFYSQDNLLIKLDKKDTNVEFISNSPYFKISNTVYYFDCKTQTLNKIDTLTGRYFTYENLLIDSVHCYNKNSICTYQNESITYVKDSYFKTKSYLIKYYNDNFIEISKLDGSSLKHLRGAFFKDKNDVYYDGKPLNIPKANLNKVTFFNNSSYFFTDSEFVYFKNERLKLDFSSFNYISDHFFFDQKGIYQLNYSWISHGKDSISTIPFKFIKPINRDSVVYYAQKFIRYENQLFDISKNLFYYNVPFEFLKKDRINIYELSPYVDSNSIFTYNRHFYKYKNKLHKTDSKKVYNVDIKTFKELFVSNYFTGYYKDKDHVYIYNQSGRFNILDSVSPSTFREFKPIFGMMQDDQYAYFENNRIFKISDIESIEYISYQRPDLPPSECGLDKSHHFYTSSFLLKNKDGYWLVNKINLYDYDIYMDRQEIKYRKLSNGEMREIESLKKKNAIQLKSML